MNLKYVTDVNIITRYNVKNNNSIIILSYNILIMDNFDIKNCRAKIASRHLLLITQGFHTEKKKIKGKYPTSFFIGDKYNI